MITYNLQNINDFNKNISNILKENNINPSDLEATVPKKVVKLINSAIQAVMLTGEFFVGVKCPKCGQTHLVPLKEVYKRNLKLKVGNILIDAKIDVPQVKCKNCGSKHALLPEDLIVPFNRYSKGAIFEIAEMSEEIGAEETANTLNIDTKQVRKCVNTVKRALPNLSLLVHKLELIDEYEKLKLKEVFKLIKENPNLEEEYFRNFREPFLYKKVHRELYIGYEKLSF